MSELRSERGTLASPPAALSTGRTSSYYVRPRAAAPGPDAALAGARDALRRIPFSREALRDAVVRYGTLSRDAGANVADLRDALEAALAPALARLPDGVAAELRAHAGWWAAHGYHRGD